MILKNLHEKRSVQLCLGLVMGIVFGFLLQKGGVTRYNVIIGQLLLRDFTVVKVMLSAMVTGMIGVHLFQSLGMVQLHPKPGSVGSVVIGGLIFGVGFGLLGYCPGTMMGAVGQGSLDALFGGVVGMLIGTGLFSVMHTRLEKNVLTTINFGEITWPEVLRVHPWWVVTAVAIGVTAMLLWMEKAGL
jgi:hypothetical protein